MLDLEENKVCLECGGDEKGQCFTCFKGTPKEMEANNYMAHEENAEMNIE